MADELEPYLDLAREIHHEVARVAADDEATLDALTEALDRIPADARLRMAESVFAELDPERQWEILERLFDDDELRAALAGERARRTAPTAGQFDTRTVPVGEQLTLGLFLEGQARAAIGHGSRSTTAARELVLRGTGPGEFRVVRDTFNPDGGYVVTRAYDRSDWEAERLPAHALVRVGSITDAFEPILYPGGRVDLASGDEAPVPGRLHLGYAAIGAADVFA